jgi:hypothetical protein
MRNFGMRESSWIFAISKNAATLHRPTFEESKEKQRRKNSKHI